MLKFLTMFLFGACTICSNAFATQKTKSAKHIFFVLAEDGGEHAPYSCEKTKNIKPSLIKNKEYAKLDDYLGSVQTEFADNNEAAINAWEHYFTSNKSCTLALEIFNKSLTDNTLDTKHQSLEIKKNSDGKKCLAMINKKIVQEFACEFSYPPTIIASYSGKLGLLSEAIVIQEQPMGNACNGGNVYIIGIGNKGEYKITKPIDFCGGPEPIVKLSGTEIIITFPYGKANRGDNKIPTETWKYSNWILQKGL